MDGSACRVRSAIAPPKVRWWRRSTSGSTSTCPSRTSKGCRRSTTSSTSCAATARSTASGTMRFVFVDRIVSLTPGESATATRTVPADEDYFQDHFPGFPVVPGVLLTETMGQVAAKCLDAERRPRGKAMLARILSATFRQWVRPGDRLELHASIVSNEERFATAECRALVEGRPVAQAKLFFSFTPIASFAPGYRDDVLEAFLAARGQ